MQMKGDFCYLPIFIKIKKEFLNQTIFKAQIGVTETTKKKHFYFINLRTCFSF